MRTLVHLSDLRFGRVPSPLLAPLSRMVHRIAPQLVVVSGDLTQRARSEQFTAARDFLAGLPSPQLVVPGHHDIAMYNVVDRYAEPLDRYRHFISDDLAPAYVDEEIAVVGMNTAVATTVKEGRANREQLAAVRRSFDDVGQDVVRIVVTHHPFDLPATADQQSLAHQAHEAMQLFAECGVDLVLAGQAHEGAQVSESERYHVDEYPAVVVLAGDVSAFNVLQVDSNRINLTRYAWDSVHGEFSPVHEETFFRAANLWAAHQAGMLAAGI